MLGRRRFPRFVAAALWFALTGTCVVVLPTPGQVENVIRSNARMFPGIGADVRAIKRDSAGHYYILAKPQNAVWVYGADGQRLGQIPNANSGGATIGYAADIDVDSSGNLLVADRGSNAVEIFGPDGSLVKRIPILAPMSLVALSGGRFAVVTLRSDYLVAIFDEQGRKIYQFGDPVQLGIQASPDSMRDLGKIYGDPDGYIYFAFTSMPDPTIRKYDRVGYLAYNAELPISDFDFANKPEDRVQFGINVSQMNFSDQVGAWATIGTSGALHFGSGVGTGLGERMRGFMGPGGGNGSGGGFGNPNEPNYSGGINSVGVFGQGSLEQGSFHFNMGARLGGRNGANGRSGRRGGGAMGPSDATDSSDSGGLAPGAVLQFDSSNGFGSEANNNANGSPDDTETLSTTEADQSDSQDSVLGTSPNDSPFATDLDVLNYQPGMFGGSMAFHPHRFGGFGGGAPGGASGPGAFHAGDLAGAHFSPSGFPLGSAGAGAAGHFPMFGAPGHFVFDMYNVEASVRINLDRPAPNSREKPALTAVGVDPETGEAWAAIGNALVHLAKDGTELGTYYVATPDGAPLRPDAILVEHDRLLLAVDPLGIYSVARPDLGSARTPQSTLSAQPARPSD
jgi:hypothetical protein